jgi:hypothetical protein
MFANRKMKNITRPLIAHIGKASQPDAKTKALPKSAILQPHQKATTRFTFTY